MNIVLTIKSGKYSLRRMCAKPFLHGTLSPNVIGRRSHKFRAKLDQVQPRASIKARYFITGSDCRLFFIWLRFHIALLDLFQSILLWLITSIFISFRLLYRFEDCQIIRLQLQLHKIFEFFKFFFFKLTFDINVSVALYIFGYIKRKIYIQRFYFFLYGE